MPDFSGVPPAIDPTRLEGAVARELARRRRLLRLYLLLLLVPLGIAAAFLLWGRSDRELVAEEVTARVAPVERSYREIRPALEEVRDLRAALPEVRESQERVEQLARGHQEVASRVEALATDLREVRPQIEQLRQEGGGGERLAAIERRFEALRPVLARAEASQAELASLKQELAAQRRDLGEVQTRQRRILDEVGDLRVRVERQPGPAGASVDLQKVLERLQALERDTAEVEGQVKSLRSRILQPPG